MAELQPLEHFDFSNQNKSGEWKERFCLYRKATKLNKEDEEIQDANVVYSMGKKLKIY